MARTPGGTLSAFTLLSTPDAPTIDSVTTSIGSASVAFTAPTDVGDAAVSSYVVTAVDESSGASTGATGSASPITVTPPAGGTFKIRMQALNAYGPGRLTEYDAGNVIYSGASLWGWGNNSSNGQVGDNTTINRSSPVQVGALTTWSKISSGGYNGAAINTSGVLFSWGNNFADGQVGDGTTNNRSSPVQVGSGFLSISVLGRTMVATKTNKTLWTWGSGSNGQRGSNSDTNSSLPGQIGALTDWQQVSAGQTHCLAVKTNNTLWSWGNSASGQLGDATVASKSSPIQIGSLTNWSQVDGGMNHSAAVKTDSTLWVWGANNYGQLGDNTIINKSSPIQVGALSVWASVSCQSFCVAIRTNGTLWAWGLNSSGQLGDGTSVSRSSPVQIGSLTNWSQASAGVGGCSSVKTDNTLWRWGGNVGDNTSISKSSPVQIGALNTWYAVASGASTLALYGVV